MNAEKRRREIGEILARSDRPVSASALASRFSVSRQIIVGDIAIMRASGADISATPRGYVSGSYYARGGIRRKIACIHTGDQIALELNIMVDNGCTVADVTVEHPVYGEITGELGLASRYDVSEFVRKLREEDAAPLSSLTGGVHLHTLICPDEEAFSRVTAKLGELGILFTENIG